MTSFDSILDEARARHGDALDARLAAIAPRPRDVRVGDDRWLSGMAKRVFSAGFVWRVIEAKWPGFEEAFGGFDPGGVAAFDAQDIEALAADTRIVRNRQKILATIHNAGFVLDVAAAHGSFGAWVAAWPERDPVGLWDALATGGKRLGGDTGPRLLRMMGKDTFVLTADVCHALGRFGGPEGRASSKRFRRAAQDAIVAWSTESGMSLGQVSIVLACSGDAPR